ncbi:hypothetical protein CNR34_00121 [Pseudomonas phage nickie]|uniref:Uncharacterized protein n=1 Tax=Pseudomonas phage nickie TaxID=2048977 RepID=A0A2H4P786_9CAUD|nr:hypothetical protein FDJ16_gp044 [Pseudomonas phage nickie]ATW58054.1 hypothetical protein CNR34_00121 [Pseudomonas phage nickie]
MHLSPEYNLVKSYYGDQRAKRSGVLKMNHIDEGIEMLRVMGASELAIKAYCLHPLAQGGDFGWEMVLTTPGLNPKAVILSTQYRDKANAYLCRPNTDHYTVESLNDVIGPLSQDLIHMLVADKIQNEKDFDLYHKGTHARSAELSRYFCIWLDYLEVAEANLKKESGRLKYRHKYRDHKKK